MEGARRIDPENEEVTLAEAQRPGHLQKVCQMFRFSPIKNEKVQKLLKKQGPKENGIGHKDPELDP